jgi:hypothetical protein
MDRIVLRNGEYEYNAHEMTNKSTNRMLLTTRASMDRIVLRNGEYEYNAHEMTNKSTNRILLL